jgi:hypothetical protein
MKTKDIVIGNGEIGTAISNLFNNDVITYDLKDGGLKELKLKIQDRQIRIMHISIPYSDTFIKQVKGYTKIVNPLYIVIHSTVPVGTCKKCLAIHSPVTGIHPHLTESLKTFVKYFGGPGASEVADLFRRQGVRVYVTDKAETTELMKILCTTNYGLNIEYTKEAKRLCDEYKVPFEMFTLWNNNYNEGYDKLGYPEYHRYNLVPMMKQIGGHCVVNNYKLLKSKFVDFLRGL